MAVYPETPRFRSFKDFGTCVLFLNSCIIAVKRKRIRSNPASGRSQTRLPDCYRLHSQKSEGNVSSSPTRNQVQPHATMRYMIGKYFKSAVMNRRCSVVQSQFCSGTINNPTKIPSRRKWIETNSLSLYNKKIKNSKKYLRLFPR